MSEHTVRVASRITGIAKNVPPRVVTNDHFASYLETSDEWIRERTGIRERRWAAPETPLSELVAPAALEAIRRAGLRVEDIDGIICATVTPDYLFPGGACCIQKRLGMKRGFAFDINAVCSGFIYALACADGMVWSGLAQHLLVVGADIFSTVVDSQDRSTCVLFGDGAGAAVLSRAVGGSAGARTGGQFVEGSVHTLRGVLQTEVGADGSLGDLLCVERGTASALTPDHFRDRRHFLRMAGKEVFKLAVRSIAEVSQRVLERSGLSIEDVDFVVAHQANKRILSAVAEQLRVPPEKFLVNIERYGNTSAASVPLLLAESVERGIIQEGHLVLLNAFGGGLTWGAALIRW